MTDMQAAPVRVGTDALQTVIHGLADLAKLGSDLSQGFSMGEVGELLGLAQDVKDVLANVANVIPQYADLDDAERATLVAYVQANVKFPSNASVESILQKVLDAAIALSNLFKLAQTGKL